MSKVTLTFSLDATGDAPALIALYSLLDEDCDIDEPAVIESLGHLIDKLDSFPEEDFIQAGCTEKQLKMLRVLKQKSWLKEKI